jgi:phage gp29-like protein
MLKDLANLLTGAFAQRAPKQFPRQMLPVHHRPSQSQNLDVDVVHAAISSAQGGDMTALLSLYRDIEASDNVIQSAISTRKLAVLARGWNVVPAPNTGESGQRVADEVQAMLERSESFVDACTWLLHGAIWPVSVVNLRWVPGGNGYSHAEFRNVPLELFDYSEKCLRIKDVDSHGTPMASTHTPDEARYIVHRGHMLMAPDTWGGPLRALVFWFLFSTQDREWWARFLERYGAPFLVGYYDQNDDDSRLNLVSAFSEATRLFGIVATKETQVELKESANASNSSQSFKDFHEAAKNEKLLLILGQTLSGNAESTGLGSGVAGLQGKVRDDVRLWDALKLARCLKSRVIVPWMKLNGITGPAPDIGFGGFDPSLLAGLAPFLESLAKAGLDLDEDGITMLSRHVGMNLVRRSAPATPGADAVLSLAAALAPSTLANEAVARDAAADLSRAFSGDLAPLGEIVRSSRSRPELLARAGAFLAQYRPGKAQELLAAALTSHAANAAVAGAPTGA